MNVWPVSTGFALWSGTSIRKETKPSLRAAEEISLHSTRTRQIKSKNAYTAYSVSFERPGASQWSNSSSRGTNAPISIKTVPN